MIRRRKGLIKTKWNDNQRLRTNSMVYQLSVLGTWVDANYIGDSKEKTTGYFVIYVFFGLEFTLVYWHKFYAVSSVK